MLDIYCRYIRGRIQYTQVNTAVEEVNKALEAKYTLLSRPRAKLSEMSMKIVSECRRQVNEESKGTTSVLDGVVWLGVICGMAEVGLVWLWGRGLICLLLTVLL